MNPEPFRRYRELQAYVGWTDDCARLVAATAGLLGPHLPALVDDFYDNEIVGRIVEARKARKFTAEQVKKLIDDGPYSAKAAQKAGLIDRLSYFDDYSESLKEQAKAEAMRIESRAIALDKAVALQPLQPLADRSRRQPDPFGQFHIGDPAIRLKN